MAWSTPPYLAGGIFIEASNIPINFIFARASSVPDLLDDPYSNAQVGITGSDILWESGLGSEAGVCLPFYRLVPEAKRSWLFLGISQKFLDPDFRLTDLSGYSVASKFRRVAKDYFTQKGVKGVNTFYIPGTDEAIPYLREDCVGVLGTTSSGATAKANDIEIMDRFLEVSIRMVTNQYKLTPYTSPIFDDFRGLIYQAEQKSNLEGGENN